MKKFGSENIVSTILLRIIFKSKKNVGSKKLGPNKMLPPRNVDPKE